MSDAMTRSLLHRISGAAAHAVAWVIAAAACGAEPMPAGMPNPPTSPTKVACALAIIDVVNIDDVNENFQAEIAVLSTWRDPRLAFDPDVEGTPVKLFQGDYQFNEVFKGWWPQIVILNEVGRDDPKAVTVMVFPDGTVRYREQRNALFETPMELHAFPFDTQRLKVSMIPFANTAGEARPDFPDYPPLCYFSWARAWVPGRRFRWLRRSRRRLAWGAEDEAARVAASRHCREEEPQGEQELPGMRRAGRQGGAGAAG